MIVDHVPVRDFAGSADPRRDMHRSYVEARRRMESGARPEPVVQAEVAPALPPEPVLIPPPDIEITREAYARAMQMRRAYESAYRPILRAISAVTGVSMGAIASKNRTAPVIKARQIAYYLIRRNTVMSYPEIGRRLKRHHTTVLAGCALVEGIVINAGITPTSDVVEMCDRLWSFRWPADAK